MGFSLSANNSGLQQRRMLEGTLYSANLEKHARPDIMSGYHAGLHQAHLDNVSNVAHKLQPFVEMGQLKYNPSTQTYTGNFPKLMLTITDPQILQKSILVNPEHYTPELMKSKVFNYSHTLSGMEMKDLDDICWCKGGKNYNKVAFEQILGEDDNTIDAMVWGNCIHTIVAAAKRQMRAAPEPDPKVSDDFFNFAKDIIEKELGPYLDNFGYSYDQWFSHLPYKKQQLMTKILDAIDADKPLELDPQEYKQLIHLSRLGYLDPHYEGICKIEVQATDGKPRMVCSIPQLIKLVMGPITWMLEDIAADHLQGYCGGKNLQQMSDMVNHYASQGFTAVVEGDGSAFDNTQDVTLKRIDRYIYQRVADSLHHLPEHTVFGYSAQKLFKVISQSLYKTMDVIVLDPRTKRRRKIMEYSILGTVFSGDCDTTLCNTIRMALYNRYVMERAGFHFGQDYICYSKGDDFTVQYNPALITADSIEAAYYKYFLRPPDDSTKNFDCRVYGIGQICKFLDFGQLNSIKFCSLRAWYTDRSHTRIFLTRDPAKFYTLSKYSRKTKCMTQIKLAEYLIAQAVALEQYYTRLDLFEAMAGIYRWKARQLTSNYTMLAIATTAALRLGDQRVTLDPNKEAATKNVWFGDYIQFKDPTKVHKIVDNYWDSIKMFENQTSTVGLSQEAIEYINQQIADEFSIDELELLLAPNKRTHEL